MQSRIFSALAVALSSLVLFSAVTMTTAAPQGKKKPQGKKPAPTAPNAKAAIAAGKKIYDANSCGACHLVSGKGGSFGPELTHIGSNKEWPADKLSAVVRDPKKVLNSEKMPANGKDKISDKDLKSLVAYLQSLK